MKKILILLILFLTGCNIAKNEYLVIINVESNVIPEINSSLNTYRFYVDTMQFIAKTNKLEPINISFYKSGYQTENVYISTSELLQKRVEKTVRFVEQKKTQIEIELLGSSKINDFDVEGIEYETKDNKIIATVDKDKDLSIKINAEGYETQYLNIYQDDLVYGFYNKQIVLNKSDEIIYLFRYKLNLVNIQFNEFISNKEVKKVIIDDGEYYILKKGYEYTYKYNNQKKYVYADENKEILIKGDDASLLYKTAVLSNLQVINNLDTYYFYNGLYYQKNFNSSTKIPYGAQLVYFDTSSSYNRGYYFENNNLATQHIDLSKNKASYQSDLFFDLRIYDVVNKRYITKVINNGVEINSNEENFFQNVSLINLKDYEIMNKYYISDLVKINGKYYLDIEVIPKTIPLAIRFIDENGTSLSGIEFNADTIYLGSGIYQFLNLEEQYNYGPLKIHYNENSFTNIVATYKNREITITEDLFLGRFNKDIIPNYFLYVNDFKIDTRRINLKISFVSSTLTLEELSNIEKNFILQYLFRNISYNVFKNGIENVMVGDSLKIVTSKELSYKEIDIKVTESFVNKTKLIVNVDYGTYTLE